MINKGLTLVSNMFCNLNLTDMETCYKVFRTDLLKSIPIRSDRFGFEPEIVMKSAKRQVPHLRSAHQLSRPHLRGRQEDRLEGRHQGAGRHLAFWLIDDLYAAPYGRGVLNNLTGTPQYLSWLARILRPPHGRRGPGDRRRHRQYRRPAHGPAHALRGRRKGSPAPARPAQPFPAHAQRRGAAHRSRSLRRISPAWKAASIRCFASTSWNTWTTPGARSNRCAPR